ncbi:MAG: hypothetical protein IIZ67_04790 [Bacilli bacterium]|nr:hypothetical protein [Bacilli bacterium]
MNKNTYKFEEIIKNIEKFKLGTKIKSKVGDVYNLSQAEGEGKRRKFSRWNGTRLRFMTYENIGREFEIIEDEKDIQSIETLNPYDTYFKDGTELVYKLMYDKINEIAMKVNQLDKKVNSIEQK